MDLVIPGITQTQQDSLRAQLALATQPAPPPPPQTGELYTAYNSAFLGNRTYRPVGVDANGNPGNPPVSAAVFLSQAVDATHGIVIWGTDTEHQAVITAADGEQWAALISYGSTADQSIAYPEEIVKCTWTNLDTGAVRDMAKFNMGPGVGIMCPQVLPGSGNYRIRQWGWVWNSPTGARVRPFYWQCDYLFGTSINNPAWTKDAQKNRPAIKYSEVWWDESVGWVRGTAPTLPWLGTPPAPADVNVTYLGWDSFGKGAGTLWQYQYPDYKVALSS